MKLTNFKFIGKYKEKYVHATVDCITGILWWKKTTSRNISRPVSGLYWNFDDTGELTPDRQAENMYNGYLISASRLSVELHSENRDKPSKQ